MWTYLARRLLLAIPILLGILTVTFVLFHVVGGDPVLQKAGRYANAETRQKISEKLGTDKPLAVQYGRFLVSSVTLDFGNSFRDERPVKAILVEGLGPSLSLTVPAFLLETVIAVALALFCAFYRATLIDRLTVVGAVALMSIPGLAYILFAQKVVAHEWKLFPFFGYQPLPAGAVFFVLPVLIWLALAIGSEVRFYRAVMLEEMSQDYVRTAAAKGLPARRILFGHVLKNSMIQVITRVVISIPFLMLGSLLLEVFFGIPGLGNRTVEAVNRSDFPVVQAFVVIGSLLYIVFSILTDLCYAWVDPRVRLR